MKKQVPILMITLAFSCVPAFYPIREGMTFTVSQTNSVDLTPFGIAQQPVIHESALLSAIDKDDQPTASSIHDLAHAIPQVALPVVIDMKQWGIYTKDTVKRKENLQKLISLIESLREVRPDLQLGYAEIAPQRIYEPQANFSLSDWHRFNDAAKADFAPHVDAIFPSLYTVYPDPKAWKTFAIQTLKEARRFNKPVYALLSPKFHPSNPLLRGQSLPPVFWRLELETCLSYCDGIVIWNPEPQKKEDAPWIKETMAFIETLKKVDGFQNPLTPK